MGQEYHSIYERKNQVVSLSFMLINQRNVAAYGGQDCEAVR